jgi:hypothetical protein
MVVLSAPTSGGFVNSGPVLLITSSVVASNESILAPLLLRVRTLVARESVR